MSFWNKDKKDKRKKYEQLAAILTKKRGENGDAEMHKHKHMHAKFVRSK